MRNCSTCCPHSKSLNFGVSQTRSDEKLAFVENVLAVLIESRFGPATPYTRLGEQPVTTGHSQMFANVTLLSAAEIEAHLNFAETGQAPCYLGASLGRPRANHLRHRVAVLCGELILISESDAVPSTSMHKLAVSRPSAHTGGSPSRGSPTFLGRD